MSHTLLHSSQDSSTLLRTKPTSYHVLATTFPQFDQFDHNPSHKITEHMGNNNSLLTLEIIPEDELNYEEMTKAPPATMTLVRQSNQSDGAFTTPKLPWPTYILDAWYTPQLAKYMVSRPHGSIKLTKADVELLQSHPDSDSEQIQELADRVQSQFPTTTMTTTTPAFQCFVRLSMCSTKVGAHAKPASSGMEVVQQILESHRCVNSLSCPIDHHTIWLFEWNHACDITREFRVFLKDLP